VSPGLTAKLSFSILSGVLVVALAEKGVNPFTEADIFIAFV
jgi:hypothetical protein